MTVQALSLPALWGTFRTQVIGRKFARDVGILTVANFVGAALSFVQGILVARWLGPELYGVAALVMSYPLLVYTFFDARSPEASVKYLSEFHVRNERDRALAMCKLGYMVDSAIASLTFLVVLITAPWAAQSVAHRPEAVGLIMIYAAAFVPNALIGTSCAALMTLGRFVLIAWVDVLANFLRVTLVLGLVLTDWQVPGIVWGNAIATMATGLLYGIIARVLIRRAWGVSSLQGGWHALKGRRREIFSFLAYNDLNALLGMIPKQLDVALLGYFRNPMEVGYYRLAKNLAGAVSYAVRPLQLVTYPDLARLWNSGDHQALQQKVWRLAIQVGLPLGLAVLAGTPFIPFVLALLVGDAYRPAVVTTQLLFIGSAVWLAFFWLRPLFLARAWVKEWTGCIALFALCNLAGWLLIVPRQGHLGMSAWWLVSTIGVYTIPPLVFLLQNRSRKTDWETYSAQLVALRNATATDFELLKSLARGRVLDAGCGVGIHLARLTSAGVQEAIGVDVGMPGLRYGKSNTPNAIFIAASLYHLPFQDNQFDFIYSIDVVEHLEKPLLAIEEYYRVCRPGGLVFVQTPNYPIKRLYDLWHWLRRSKQHLADDPTHVSHFNSFELRDMMVEAGLRVVSISARNIAFQRFLPRSLRSTWFGHRFGQKIITVAFKL